MHSCLVNWIQWQTHTSTHTHIDTSTPLPYCLLTWAQAFSEMLFALELRPAWAQWKIKPNSPDSRLKTVSSLLYLPPAPLQPSPCCLCWHPRSRVGKSACHMKTSKIFLSNFNLLKFVFYNLGSAKERDGEKQRWGRRDSERGEREVAR